MNPIKDEMNIEVNYTNAGKHQPPTERNNRTIKESFRVALHQLAYQTIPCKMIQTLAIISVNRLNMFPAKHGVSSYYSPAVIMMQLTLDYIKHCQYSFGEYVQAHTDDTDCNMMAWAIYANYLHQTPTNKKCGHEFMNLNTTSIFNHN